MCGQMRLRTKLVLKRTWSVGKVSELNFPSGREEFRDRIPLAADGPKSPGHRRREGVVDYFVRLFTLASATVCGIFFPFYVAHLGLGYKFTHHRFAPGIENRGASLRNFKTGEVAFRAGAYEQCHRALRIA